MLWILIRQKNVDFFQQKQNDKIFHTEDTKRISISNYVFLLKTKYVPFLSYA